MRLTRDEQHYLNMAELRGGMNAIFGLMRKRVIQRYKERADELDRAGEQVPLISQDVNERKRILLAAFMDTLDMPRLVESD